MSIKKIYQWVKKNNSYNSLYIYAEYINKVLCQNYKDKEVYILHSNIKNIKNKLNEISSSDDCIIFWHYGVYDQYLRYVKDKSKLVFIYHNINPARYFWLTDTLTSFRAICTYIQLMIMKNNTIWIARSDFNKKKLLRFGFKEISVCPNITSLPSYIQTPKSDKMSLLFVGRLVENKNCINLLTQVEKVSIQLEKRIELIIVGDVRNQNIYGSKFKKKYQLLKNKNVINLTWYKNIDESFLTVLYQKSWLYISLSYHEGFGIPACEAIANGTPALYLQCGGQESVLDNWGMVPLKKKKCFNKYVVELLKNSKKRIDLLSNQQKIVRSIASPKGDKLIMEVFGKCINQLN